MKALAKLLILTLTLTCTACGKVTDKDNNSRESKHQKEDAYIMDTSDGYKVYSLKRMDENDFPNLVHSVEIIENSFYNSVNAYANMLYSKTNLETTVPVNDLTYFDKVVVEGITITKEDIQPDKIYELMEKINQKYELYSCGVGTRGLSTKSVIEDSEKNAIGYTADFFKDRIPSTFEPSKYGHYATVIFRNPENTSNEIELSIEWGADGNFSATDDGFSLVIEIDHRSSESEIDLEYHTIYLTEENNKVAIVLDDMPRRYTGFIYYHMNK